MDNIQERAEALGPAERIIQTLTRHIDHLHHGRPGVVTEDARTTVGYRWDPVTWKKEGDNKIVYKVTKQGKRKTLARIGVLGDDNKVRSGNRVVGEYRKSGLFGEAVAWVYEQAAKVWEMDNEFAARWASWTFAREHRDIKVILAALMLVQSRSGEPVKDDGEILFHDDDFRSVGEAMCLTRTKHDISPKLLLRIGDVLALPQVADINRKLGFGKSARNAPLGRYNKAVSKWLRYREDNPKMLAGLVKAGYRQTVMKLARKVGYKPQTPAFFETLRWKQSQSKDGRRAIAIGAEVAKAESWEGLSEREICEKIVAEKPNYKRVVGLLPKKIGLTRAIMAACIQAESVSNNDLIILTPTLEELGLFEFKPIKDRWRKAVEAAENQRAANVARNVKTKEIAEGLQDAADKATAKAMEEATRDMRVYVCIDKSSSMQGALDRAKVCLKKFLGGIPLDRIHVSVFNTAGTKITIRAAKAAAVDHALRGHSAGGGTRYSAGVKALAFDKPKADEDALFIFVGDQAGEHGTVLAQTIRQGQFNPVAFGYLRVVAGGWTEGSTVVSAARHLGIPCFHIDEGMFNDPYSVTRTLRDLIASTPVGQRPGAAVRRRETLVEQILKTDLLQKPVWA